MTPDTFATLLVDLDVHPRVIMRILSHADQAATMENMPEQYQLMILLASWCALRFGELTELRRGDVDLSHARVRVTRGVTWIDGKPTIGAPKSNAGIRDVSIPPHLTSAVRQAPARSCWHGQGRPPLFDRQWRANWARRSLPKALGAGTQGRWAG
jgi:integrase